MQKSSPALPFWDINKSASTWSSTYNQSLTCNPFPYIGICSPFSIFCIVKGINFSGNCHSPKLLLQLVTINGSLYVCRQALTRWSLQALLAEYGDLGSYGVDSLNLPSSSTDPHTSSVLMWNNLNFSTSISSSSNVDFKSYKTDINLLISVWINFNIFWIVKICIVIIRIIIINYFFYFIYMIFR